MGWCHTINEKGTWRSDAELWFEERFLALETGWTLEGGDSHSHQ